MVLKSGPTTTMTRLDQWLSLVEKLSCGDICVVNFISVVINLVIVRSTTVKSELKYLVPHQRYLGYN